MRKGLEATFRKTLKDLEGTYRRKVQLTIPPRVAAIDLRHNFMSFTNLGIKIDGLSLEKLTE